jgi:hypothetical protein
MGRGGRMGKWTVPTEGRLWRRQAHTTRVCGATHPVHPDILSKPQSSRFPGQAVPAPAAMRGFMDLWIVGIMGGLADEAAALQRLRRGLSVIKYAY